MSFYAFRAFYFHRNVRSRTSRSLFSMVRIQKRISDGLEVLQYFTTREWIFHNTNLLTMTNEMTAQDKELFPIDFLVIDIMIYLKHCMLGARQYCMKEDLSTLPKARRHQAMYVFNIILCTCRIRKKMSIVNTEGFSSFKTDRYKNLHEDPLLPRL